MASARELRRQQREEEGPGDEAEGAEEGPGPPRANLSPSSSFRAQRSARGSTFSLWQDIPDVRGSGVLATLSLRDCKLQEVRRGPGGAGPAGLPVVGGGPGTQRGVDVGKKGIELRASLLFLGQHMLRPGVSYPRLPGWDLFWVTWMVRW